MHLPSLQVRELVLTFVLCKISLLGESFIAQVTFVRFFTHVHAYVVFEVPFLLKHLTSPWNFADKLLYFSASFRVSKVFSFIRVNIEQVLVVLPVVGVFTVLFF